MRATTKAAVKRWAPAPVLRLYPSLYRVLYRARHDGGALARYVAGRCDGVDLVQKLQLLRQLRLISREVDCPHEEREMLAILTALFALPETVEGCIVEAGSYKGGSTAKLSLAARLVGRRLYAFDSFEGLPDNQESHERDIFGHDLSFPGGSYAGSFKEVRDTVSRYGDIGVCELVKGWFDDTLPPFDEKIAGLFLDVDLASSTRTCLRHLYPRLSPGGLLCSHDGHVPLVLELFQDDRFWLDEVGSAPPRVIGAGTEKLLFIRKPC